MREKYEPVSHYLSSDSEAEDGMLATSSGATVKYIEEERPEPEASARTVVLAIVVALIGMLAAAIGGVL
jgi:hypothetical protein